MGQADICHQIPVLGFHLHPMGIAHQSIQGRRLSSLQQSVSRIREPYQHHRHHPVWMIVPPFVQLRRRNSPRGSTYKRRMTHILSCHPEISLIHHWRRHPGSRRRIFHPRCLVHQARCVVVTFRHRQSRLQIQPPQSLEGINHSHQIL